MRYCKTCVDRLIRWGFCFAKESLKLNRLKTKVEWDKKREYFRPSQLRRRLRFVYSPFWFGSDILEYTFSQKDKKTTEFPLLFRLSICWTVTMRLRHRFLKRFLSQRSELALCSSLVPYYTFVLQVKKTTKLCVNLWHHRVNRPK